VKLKGKGNQIQFTFNSEIIVDLEKLQKHISQTISHRPIYFDELAPAAVDLLSLVQFLFQCSGSPHSKHASH
jgi:hypothetical protein